MENISIKAMNKYSNELSEFKVTCKCGHKVLITNLYKGDYKICSCCGRRVYRNEELKKREEFKTNLLRRLKNA